MKDQEYKHEPWEPGCMKFKLDRFDPKTIKLMGGPRLSDMGEEYLEYTITEAVFKANVILAILVKGRKSNDERK